jgi:hypothetical protein
MKNDLYIQPDRQKQSKLRNRLLFLICWIFISIITLLFPFSLKLVSAGDVTPTPTTTIEDPIFPSVTPEPDNKICPPLYAVPLALNPHDHFYFTRPIAADTNTEPSMDFLYGYYYPKEKSVHTGVDITSPLHKPVLAAGDGKVVFAGYGLLNGGGDVNDPYGKAVMIKHDFVFGDKTIYTVYAHMDRIDVKVGQMVNAGDQIGIIGLTGNTSGPHVHFEVRVDDSDGSRVQNPELWLAPPIGDGVLAGRFKDDYGYLISAQKFTLKSLDTGNTYDILTYAPVKQIYTDDYFHENFAIGDLPAGQYQVSMIYMNTWYRSNITIAPGTVNFIFFNGKYGFTQENPSAPDPEEFLQ